MPHRKNIKIFINATGLRHNLTAAEALFGKPCGCTSWTVSTFDGIPLLEQASQSTIS
ncbi:MAG: hypothetical protein AB9891_05665 [Anaerolineaceae bacterium]